MVPRIYGGIWGIIINMRFIRVNGQKYNCAFLQKKIYWKESLQAYFKLLL